MTSIIEQIREAEAQLPALNETARRTHAEAMEDGEISPDEQRKIDTIDGKISNLRDMVQRLQQGQLYADARCHVRPFGGGIGV